MVQMLVKSVASQFEFIPVELEFLKPRYRILFVL